MDLETRLRDALNATGEERDVDVSLLHRRTRERIDAWGPSRRRRRTVPLLFAAGTALAVTAGALLWAGPVRNAQVASDGGSPGRVDTAFTCPARTTLSLDGSQDEFLPDVQTLGGPTGVAREYAASRWSFDVVGDRATLRLGNEDGTLGSITSYLLGSDGWDMESAEACSGAGGGPGAPTSDELRLSTRDGEGWSWPAVPGPKAAALLIDDRPVYDYSGLITSHTSMSVVPCGTRLCWRTGRPDSYVQDRLPGTPQLRDVTGLLFRPDDMVGRAATIGMWAVWDRDGTVDSISVRLPDGSEQGGQSFTDPSWDGAVLHVVLAPREPGERIVVAPTHGDELTQVPEQLPGYDPSMGD